MTATAIGYTLAGLIAAGIILIGARFIVAPRVAAAGYGVVPDSDQSSVECGFSAKGVRDIASGLFVIVLMVSGATHLVGWLILAATIIPIADAIIVLRNGGATSIALGVHGVTGVVMLITSALLLIP